MNTITRRTTLALAAAVLSTGLASCSDDPAPQAPAQQQFQLPPEEASKTYRIPTPCDDYLHGWERARCTR